MQLLLLHSFQLAIIDLKLISNNKQFYLNYSLIHTCGHAGQLKYKSFSNTVLITVFLI